MTIYVVVFEPIWTTVYIYIRHGGGKERATEKERQWSFELFLLMSLHIKKPWRPVKHLRILLILVCGLNILCNTSLNCIKTVLRDITKNGWQRTVWSIQYQFHPKLTVHNVITGLILPQNGPLGADDWWSTVSGFLFLPYQTEIYTFSCVLDSLTSITLEWMKL